MNVLRMQINIKNAYNAIYMRTMITELTKLNLTDSFHYYHINNTACIGQKFGNRKVWQEKFAKNVKNQFGKIKFG